MNAAFLQCHRIFFLPNIAPAICNVAWIIGAFSLRNCLPKEAIVTLSKWIVFGLVLQWFLIVPSVVKRAGKSFSLWWNWKNFSMQKEVIQLARAFALGAVGVGAVQLNSFFDSLFFPFC